jgi:hypothetical protein
MPVRVAWLLVVFGLLGGPRVALAEKVKTNQPAKLYDKQGERGRVLLKIKEGQTMTVLNKDGRWLKVRVNGRTGFVPRSKVDMPDDDELARNTRRRPFVDGRGTKRGFGGEEGPDDRVGADAVETRGRGNSEDDDGGGDDEEEPTDDDEPKASKGKSTKKKLAVKERKSKEREEDPSEQDEPEDAIEVKEDERPTARLKAKTTVHAEPDADSDAAFAATKSTVLYPTGNKKGKYTEVENEEGDLGYVLTSKLEVADVDDVDEPVGRPRSRQLDARARLGVTFIGQTLATSGGSGMVPDNYKLGTSAITLAVGGGLYYPYGKQYVLGGDLGYDLAKAYPGITVDGSTTSLTVHNLNVRAVGGYDLKKKSGMMAFARLGLRYWSYQVANVSNLAKNTAKLPSEIITAPTLGGALSIPKLTPTIGLRFSIDAILFGASLKQTKGLEDGSNPSAKAACLGAGMTYRWKKTMDIQATYDLQYAKVSFDGLATPSMRGHPAGADVSRTDLFHVLTVGIAHAF